jgi:predicted neuraminidase
MMIKQSIQLATLMISLACLYPASAADPAADTDELLKQPGVVSADFIFDSAPFAQCHASTIADTPSGLVAAWFGGTKEQNPDVGIWLSRLVDGQWTAPVEVANGIQHQRTDGSIHRYPCWNPVLFQPRKQADVGAAPLLLFYKCGPDPSAWWGMMTTSTDGGATWSEPRRLPEGIIGPVKNKPVELEDGTVVCPSSTEDHGWRLHLETTRDLGKTWTRTGPLNDGVEKGAIQPSILFHKEGGWQMLARDRHRVGNVWSTRSDDQGKTWSELESTGLPNPSSGTDALTLADGDQLLVYNHRQRASEDAPSAGSRAFLNVAVSDNGSDWNAALVLEDGDGEYSYPAVIQTDDGLLHITYTWNRRRIKHVVVDPAKLERSPIVDGKWPAAMERDN